MVDLRLPRLFAAGLGLSLASGSVAATIHSRDSDLDLSVVARGLPDVVVDTLPVCAEIESKISSASRVIWPAQAASFSVAIHHWYHSSTQTPTCVAEVGSVRDLSTVVEIVGRTNTPFAVKSGGHASNPGFSSTPGVHISLAPVNHIIVSPDNKTVEIGFGNHWTDVFKTLVPLGLNVVGGRVPGPGVGGFTLGGGYSWKTNQFGLTVDTVKRFDVVLPNGTFTRASETENQDLFFALKGGMNRFGIVVSALMETHPQPPQIYGGIALYGSHAVPALINATSRFFYENTDEKATLITTLEGSPTGTQAIVIFFNDGPTKPAAYDLFDGIPPLVTTVKKQSFLSFINSIPAPLSQLRNPRGGFITISTSELSLPFLEAVRSEVDAVGREMGLHGGTVASFELEPFLKYGKWATESAYPHHESPLPLNLYFAWATSSQDTWWWSRMRQAIENLKEKAKEEGIYANADVHPAYPNYSLFDEPVEEMYGPTNAARLRVIRNKYDPQRVMDLAGGFDI